MALLDLAAKCAHQPVWKFLGGAGDPRVPIVRIIPLKSPEATAEIGAQLVSEGFKALKLKASGDLEHDVARIHAVAERVGPNITLYVDANQAYDSDGAIEFFRRLEGKVSRLEQPIAAMDLPAMAKVTQTPGLFFEADEKFLAVGTLSASPKRKQPMVSHSSLPVQAVSSKLWKWHGWPMVWG